MWFSLHIIWQNTGWFAIVKLRDELDFLTHLRVVDDIVNDMYPPVDKWDKQYS